MVKNIAYWMSPTTNAQIHLVANITVWYASLVGVITFLTLFLFYLLRRQRECYDISEDNWRHFLFLLELFPGGYALHYLPYFLEDRTLFLHHYLPSVVYKVIALAAVGDHLYHMSAKSSVARGVIKYSCVVLLAVQIQAFLSLSIFSYGSEAPTKQQIESLRWVDTWDFLTHDSSKKK